MSTLEIIRNVFGHNVFQDSDSPSKSKPGEDSVLNTQESLNLVNEYIDSSLGEETDLSTYLEDNRPGRIGNKDTRFDTTTHNGLFVMSPDRLSLNSQGNFSTMKANVGVYQGKWIYEVQLGSKGIMQLGWSTLQCKFNHESGVGDTGNSYAYDGNRVRKWNVSTHKYGESWLSGDIIGCAIDMDEGSIEYYRNGKSLGTAFEHISMGPGCVYFPTVSLAYNENLTANFGATPLRYPNEKYEPLQIIPTKQLNKATILFEWFENLIQEYVNIKKGKQYSLTSDESMSIRSFLGCITRSIMKNIGPLLRVPYIVEANFMPFIQKVCNLKRVTIVDSDIHQITQSSFKICLDLMWTFLGLHEMKACLESAVVYLLSTFRHVSLVLEYPDQRRTLTLLTNLCQHTMTRQHLLKFVLFDKVKFANFVHVKPLDEGCLADVVNKIWWETDPVDQGIELNKETYLHACEQIKSAISNVEELQVEWLITLLNNSDGTTETPTSRTIFLKKFRRFIQENLVSNRSEFLQTSVEYQTPLPITLCCFHRLLVAFRILWDSEVGTTPIYVPCRAFYDASINYSGIDRLGGVLSHLNKTYRNELINLLTPDHEVVTNVVEENQIQSSLLGGISVFARMVNLNSNGMNGANGGSTILERIGYFPYNREDRTPIRLGRLEPEISLIELLDGVILFYHAAAKKQIAKVASLRDSMNEYITAISDIKSRLELVKKNKDSISRGIQAQLESTFEVFDKKLTEQAKHMAWVRAAVYSDEKQARLAWLLKTVVLTLKAASNEGNMFTFVPDFYLEALIDLATGLKHHVHPTAPLENIEGYKDILKDIAQFLCDHFLDPRIVHANSKDTLILSLAGFVSNPMTLHALENVTPESRVKVVTNLLRPYENRAWAQSNWVLVRFWQGNGFAFRYEKSPHISKKVGPKMLQQEAITQAIKPCPSLIYQTHVKQVLLSNIVATTHFLNSVLNQLNWAFSEFIGTVQEIHNISSRPERVFIESRQLKVCATCFDLAISLLRVLEMIASVARSVFDSESVSSGNLLARLSQLLCQILNRVSSQTSSFQYVVLLDIPDLETVDHFPILAAVVGILLALLSGEMSQPLSANTIPKVTEAILTEPSFQMTSLYYILGDVRTTKIKNVKPFSFFNYHDDVNETEIRQVQEMIKHLDYYRALLPDIQTLNDDEDLCKICYAYTIAAMFKPCNHQSCRACIEHHLLNSRECFFCKAIILQVVDANGEVIQDLTTADIDSESFESS